ncbi:hypothetical protein RIF29_39100 [Crotalaria pallida]|uniref:Uncharacterized protein n=1 Tax=Crotalaria pallida TaxID=3830 RepID=A0AAN9E177_CROPI
MASTILNLTTFLFLLTLLALLNFQLVSSIDDINDRDMEIEEEEYDHDNHVVPRSRFLANTIKKGRSCRVSQNICNGVRAKKGTELLFCCKNLHCRDVLSDKNHCGKCDHKCEFGEKCCGGVCTNVLYNSHHCGKCKNKCQQGVPCESGMLQFAEKELDPPFGADAIAQERIPCGHAIGA